MNYNSFLSIQLVYLMIFSKYNNGKKSPSSIHIVVTIKFLNVCSYVTYCDFLLLLWLVYTPTGILDAYDKIVLSVYVLHTCALLSTST